MGGLAIEVDEALPAKAECYIALTLHVDGHGHTLRLQATVVHAMRNRADGFKVGLALTNLSAETTRLIERFVA